MLLRSGMSAPSTVADEFLRQITPHLPRLTAIGMRLTRQRSEAQDLVQEALTKAWANWHRFRPGGSLGAWLARILVNTFISRHRHQRVVDVTASRSDIAEHLFDGGRIDACNEPEAAWQASCLSDEVAAALAALPGHYREVVELVDLHGLAYREAAARLACPLGTIMSRLHRARRLLRDQLSDYAQEHGLHAAAA